jgi:hypothetical protein
MGMTEPSGKPGARIEIGSDPVVAAYKRHIDRTLLRENLRKTPEERVLALMALQRLVEEAQRAGRSVRNRR